MEPSVQVLYTERARAYHRFVAAMRYPQGLRAAFRDFEGLRSALKVLDAGCGSGLVTLALRGALASRCLRPGVMHGFDLTPAMLGRFRSRLRELDGAEIELREADVLHLDSLPETWRDYDLIVSSGMLEYLPRHELPAALRALRLRLAEKGVLLFFISRRNPLMRYVIEKWWSAQVYSRGNLSAALEEAGFSRVRFRSFPPTHRHLALWGHFVEARPEGRDRPADPAESRTGDLHPKSA